MGAATTQMTAPHWVRIQKDCRRTRTVRYHPTRAIAEKPLAVIEPHCQAGRVVIMCGVERRSPLALLE